jgi:hypothetical protein
MSKYQVNTPQFEGFCRKKNIFFGYRFVIEEKILEIEVETGVTDGYEIPFLAEGLFYNKTYRFMFYYILPRRTSHGR